MIKPREFWINDPADTDSPLRKHILVREVLSIKESSDIRKIISEAADKLSEARKVIGFYASWPNWSPKGQIIFDDRDDLPMHGGGIDSIGGKRAREWLSKYKETK